MNKEWTLAFIPWFINLVIILGTILFCCGMPSINTIVPAFNLSGFGTFLMLLFIFYMLFGGKNETGKQK